MSRTRRLALSIFLALVAAAAIFAIGWGTRAIRASRQAPPEAAVIAVVDLEKLFESLEQRRQMAARLTEMAAELEKEGAARREEIELLRLDLDGVLAPGTAAYKRTEEDWAKKSHRLKAFVEFAGRKLDLEQAHNLGAIYDQIKRAAREMAEQDQYDVVFVDDSIAALPGNASESEMMRQISARRMLYSSPSVDVTDLLIARMNAAFVAQSTP